MWRAYASEQTLRTEDRNHPPSQTEISPSPTPTPPLTNMSTMSAVSHPAAGEKHLIANRPQQQALHGFRRKKAGGGLADLGVKVGAYVIKPHFDADAIGLYISDGSKKDDFRDSRGGTGGRYAYLTQANALSLVDKLRTVPLLQPNYDGDMFIVFLPEGEIKPHSAQHLEVGWSTDGVVFARVRNYTVTLGGEYAPQSPLINAVEVSGEEEIQDMASHIWNFLQEAIPKAEKMRFSRHELTDPKGLRGMMAEYGWKAVAPVIADRPEWVYADDAKVVTLMRALLAKRSGSMVAAMVGQLALHHNKGLPKDTTVVGLFQLARDMCDIGPGSPGAGAAVLIGEFVRRLRYQRSVAVAKEFGQGGRGISPHALLNEDDVDMDDVDFETMTRVGRLYGEQVGRLDQQHRQTVGNGQAIMAELEQVQLDLLADARLDLMEPPPAPPMMEESQGPPAVKTAKKSKTTKNAAPPHMVIAHHHYTPADSPGENSC